MVSKTEDADETEFESQTQSQALAITLRNRLDLTMTAMTKHRDLEANAVQQCHSRGRPSRKYRVVLLAAFVVVLHSEGPRRATVVRTSTSRLAAAETL